MIEASSVNMRTSGFAAVPAGAEICTANVRSSNPGGGGGKVDVTVIVTVPAVGDVTTTAMGGGHGFGEQVPGPTLTPF